MDSRYVALDVGATGIKAALARLSEDGLHLEEVHSEKTIPKRIDGCDYVDTDRILQVLSEAMKLWGREEPLQSVGIDTFGNGYAFLNRDGEPVQFPYDYRDPRISHVMEELHRHYSDRQLYEQTGNFPFRTRGLCHLFQDILDHSANIQKGKTFLTLPGLLSYRLTGKVYTERTICSVLYLLDAQGEEWNYPVFQELGIPTDYFPPLSEPGSVIGRIAAKHLGIPEEMDTALVGVIGHDTESALIMAPEMNEEHAFVCMGTSFIFGTRLDHVVISDQTYRMQFKNMRGAFGKYSLCKDFPGFYILEQCMEKWWESDPAMDYQKTVAAAQTPGENKSFLDIGDEMFRIADSDMTETIRSFCRKTGQIIPQSIPQICRCLYESYVLYLRWNIDCLEEITHVPVRILNIFNGGIRNEYLMQLLADATQRRVVTNGQYASACGNILMQYAAWNGICSLEGLREASKELVSRKTYDPDKGQAIYWENQYRDFQRNLLLRSVNPAL